MDVRMRKIKHDDLEQIMQWRMNPEITRYMNTDPVLTMEIQEQWLKRIQQDETVRYWLIEVEGKPAGVINLADIDYEKKECNWGYYIGEQSLRSLKLAMSLEWNLYDYVFEDMNFDRLYNEVLSENRGVIKLHKSCGSRIIEVLPAFVHKNGLDYDVTRIEILNHEWMQTKKKHSYEKYAFE